ncbi:hypothetical protein AURMO_01749 [Aurantimicrobium photophilum]|uniref:Uncharacterized protein n=1 Tax=Aurantimicrobium photophilum TaxID=1987356 RepID=A0A2Z3S0I5_9MICO|nr:hypothetical protein AURMO_01749 [Aurantimicrobium photophilum]
MSTSRRYDIRNVGKCQHSPVFPHWCKTVIALLCFPPYVESCIRSRGVNRALTTSRATKPSRRVGCPPRARNKLPMKLLDENLHAPMSVLVSGKTCHHHECRVALMMMALRLNSRSSGESPALTQLCRTG